MMDYFLNVSEQPTAATVQNPINGLYASTKTLILKAAYLFVEILNGKIFLRLFLSNISMTGL
jgi:hypothetical protein